MVIAITVLVVVIVLVVIIAIAIAIAVVVIVAAVVAIAMVGRQQRRHRYHRRRLRRQSSPSAPPPVTAAIFVISHVVVFIVVCVVVVVCGRIPIVGSVLAAIAVFFIAIAVGVADHHRRHESPSSSAARCESRSRAPSSSSSSPSSSPSPRRHRHDQSPLSALSSVAIAIAIAIIVAVAAAVAVAIAAAAIAIAIAPNRHRNRRRGNCQSSSSPPVVAMIMPVTLLSILLVVFLPARLVVIVAAAALAIAMMAVAVAASMVFIARSLLSSSARPALATAACARALLAMGKRGAAPGASRDGLACLMIRMGWALPEDPVAVAAELEEYAAGSCEQVPPPRRRLRLKSAVAGESRRPPAAGASAGSGAAAADVPRVLAPRAQVRNRTPPPWARLFCHDQILKTIMGELPVRDQVTLSHASKIQRGNCVLTARGWGCARWNEVRLLVFALLRYDKPIWEGRIIATASGVALGRRFSAGLLSRKATGCAWDTIEILKKAGPLPAADQAVVALALARRSLKFAFGENGLPMMADDLRPGGRLHMPGVGAVEEWIASKAAGLPRCRPVPLARRPLSGI